MGSVTVEVAVRDDPRVLDALASLASQERRPDRVLVAASLTTPLALLEQVQNRFPSLPVRARRFSGGVVDARSASLRELDTDVTAFLDSDERAPPQWLARLIAPIESGAADFSGGPTRPLRPPRDSIERYSVLLEESIYADLVPRKVTYLPLQNTAWRTESLRRLGFDPRIPFAEDHDLETRAFRDGLTGIFVPEAWVYHDGGSETSLYRWARKRYRYLVAMTMSLLKNRELSSRLAEPRRAVRHPLRFVEAAMKPAAFVHGWVRWNRLSSRPAGFEADRGGPTTPHTR
ncbi:MAG TPA: glycosyltransferase family 2 protein [Thermoplasmata archaeon]|nr:glycosyltransferase family 2 protein [Thermoplasmata archaeon]